MKGRTIRDYLLLSWLIPLGFAVAGSAVLSLGISYLDYSNSRESLKLKLHQDGRTIARRVAAELLLKDNGRTAAVLKTLESEFAVSQITLSEKSSHSHFSAKAYVEVSESIPGVPDQYVHISAPAKPFAEYMNFRNFLFALVPIFGLVLSGFLLQRRFAHHYVIRPIQALSETSIGARSPHPEWPLEIQKISNDLAESFSHREQAVFGQLARGIIHDLRTYLNSIHTAVQLVDGSASQPEKRLSLLEKLASACSRNIPKIQEVVNLSLDSSREVVVKLNSQDLAQTLRQSVGNVSGIAEGKKVRISADIVETLSVAHDKLQLERVLTNLLKNAIEATEETSRSERLVSVSVSETDSNGVRLEIEDNGNGLKDGENVFRPLKTTKRHGYGLGLFVSKKIVEAHNGQITTGRSARLGGALFTVTLPRGQA